MARRQTPTPTPVLRSRLPSRQIEPVILVYSSDDSTFIIRRQNDELWLLDAKTYCFTMLVYEGSIINTLFGYSTTTLIPPSGEACETWTERELEQVKLVSAVNDDTFIIRRPNGQLWLLKAKTYCFGLSLREGRAILADFGYVSTTLFIPGKRPCRTWTEKEL